MQTSFPAAASELPLIRYGQAWDSMGLHGRQWFINQDRWDNAAPYGQAPFPGRPQAPYRTPADSLVFQLVESIAARRQRKGCGAGAGTGDFPACHFQKTTAVVSEVLFNDVDTLVFGSDDECNN
jgi:hypothetical protein